MHPAPHLGEYGSEYFAPKPFETPIIEHTEQYYRCEYCQSLFIPDSRGNCSCCGAPMPKGNQIYSFFGVPRRFFVNGLKTPNEIRKELGLEPISADHDIFLR